MKTVVLVVGVLLIMLGGNRLYANEWVPYNSQYQQQQVIVNNYITSPQLSVVKVQWVPVYYVYYRPLCFWNKYQLVYSGYVVPYAYYNYGY